MTQKLLPSNYLFRFCLPCRHAPKAGQADCPVLDESYTIPQLGALDDSPSYAQVRLAWSAAGLTLNLRVSGKKEGLHFALRDMLLSDCIQLFIDSRDTHNVHRASRFCHRFAFIAKDGQNLKSRPAGYLLAINRARESPRPIPEQSLKTQVTLEDGGYLLQGTIPAAAITGFDPAEHPRLGIFYHVHDAELGPQSLTLNRDFSILEDPSLWSSLELLPANG